MTSNGFNVLDLFRLDNKIALVTGSAGGLGAGVAKALAAAGATIAVHDRRDPAETVEAIGKDKAAGFVVDLSTTAGPVELFDQVRKKFGRVDILFNNAGMITRHDAVEYPLDEWLTVLQVNLTSIFQLSQLAGRDMIARKAGGKIVSIASMLSFQGGIRVPAYTATKGGVAQLTKAFANEWADKNIQVNAIAPGYMATDNTAALRADDKRSEAILERIPAGRWGVPADLAGAAVFLCSPASDYITGTVLPVDGGWLAR